MQFYNHLIDHPVIVYMEFGKVDRAALDTMDFYLPVDPIETTRVLQGSNSKRKINFYIGCTRWGTKRWIDNIYPKGTKEKDLLKHYANLFNSIELNATYYKIPTYEQTRAWVNAVGDNFIFCPKFSGAITHRKRLKGTETLVDDFLKGMDGFGKHLGPILLIPHPTMGPKTISTIESFIQSIPKDVELVVELRHPEWYSNRTIFTEVFSMLEENHVGSIITDTAGRRDCVHMRLTTPKAFIRFVGNRLHPSDYTRIDDWVQRIKKWTMNGLQTIYFFMHQPKDIDAPILLRYLIKEINKYCHTSIPLPESVKSTNSSIIPK
jgi:uncharacterized protein YecE (DUF72 family)